MSSSLIAPSSPAPAADPAPAPERPIGVFDSGIGGLSVLQALRQQLPLESFVYLADSGHAPYGERGDAFVMARSLAIAQHLVEVYRIKALVVACNTATAAAIELLRAHFPTLPLIGVEPALKPAVAYSRSGRIAVAATRGTLTSAKFQSLLQRLNGQAEFLLQPCNGLALALEDSVRHPPASAADQASQRHIEALIVQHMRPLGRFGAQAGAIDTVVLGCTHYPFARDVFVSALGADVALLETGQPVAQQTRRLLQACGLLRQPDAGSPPELRWLSTGEPQALTRAAQRWLGIDAVATHPDL